MKFKEYGPLVQSLQKSKGKYYLIKSIIGQWECYWNQKTELFGISTKATKFKTLKEAEYELENKASFHEPCHILEVTDKK